MSARDDILTHLGRQARAAPPLPDIPRFPFAGDLLGRFGESLARMGGELVVSQRSDLQRLVRDRFPQARVFCSATADFEGTRSLAGVRDPRALEDVDVGIVRARFGVAETGSVWLSEKELGVNALGFLPQHLVVLLDPKEILPGLHQAYLHPAFAEARYAVLMSGPSATADIEGVLVRGAQGVRSLTVVAC